MRRDARSSMLLAGAAIVAFAAAGLLRRAPHGGEAPTGMHESSPAAAFVTVVLGGFRGLIADALWLRASHLQDEGRYFELATLSGWIAELDPHNAEAWTFNAWNMAYNVSAMMTDPEDRWRWVANGIDLLRDRAPRTGPAQAAVLAELAWLYQNKIGDVIDPAHAHYKRQIAREGAALFPGGRATPELMTAAWRERAAARLGLDARRVETLAEACGPLDWRVAETYAVYWAALAAAVARDPLVALRAERIVYQSMALSVYKGQWDEDAPEQTRPSHRPRLDLFPFAQAAFARTIERHPADAGVREAHRGFLAGVVFLADAFGDPAVARAAFDELARRYPSPLTEAGLERYLASEEARAATHPLVQVSILKLTQGWNRP